MNIQLLNVSESFAQTKDFLTEKTDGVVTSVSEVTEKAKNYLFQLANQSVNSISETTNKTVEVVSQTTSNTINIVNEKSSQAINKISEITAQTKDAIAQTTHNLTDTATTATNQAIEKLTGVAESAIKTEENWSDSMTQAVQNAITPGMAKWINSHPVIIWLLNHPLIAFGMSLLAIFIIWGFLQIVSDVAKTVCLFILTTPFKILKSLWSLSRKSPFVKGELTANQTSRSNHHLSNNLISQDYPNHNMNYQDRLTHILRRLEAIQKEQSQLLQAASEIIQKLSKVK